jgi:hypothetical protein
MLLALHHVNLLVASHSVLWSCFNFNLSAALIFMLIETYTLLNSFLKITSLFKFLLILFGYICFV